jgi:hypothetical protein
MTGAPLSTRVIALSIVEFSRRTIWCRVRRRQSRGHYRRKSRPVFCPCQGLISAARFVRRETLLWSSFARPLITVLVGTILPLII